MVAAKDNAQPAVGLLHGLLTETERWSPAIPLTAIPPYLLAPAKSMIARLEACVSVQMESRHFLRVSDSVQGSDGRVGVVVEGSALYAVVQWANGRREEIDQFDPAVVVVERAAPLP